MGQDPFEAHLKRADEFFHAGDYRQAGQIWQAILKRDPMHAAAREGLLLVKQALAAPVPPKPLANPAEVEELLRQGSQLWDLGVPEDAIEKWERVLQLDPDNAEARAYITLVNRDLAEAGRPALPRTIQSPLEPPLPTAQLAPLPPRRQSSASREELDTLLRQASQLWDLGVPEDALEKWEHVLHLDPQNEEARAFIKRVTQEQAEAAAEPPRPQQVAPPPPPPPAEVFRNEPTTSLPSQLSEGEDPRLRQGEHLLELGRFDEAVFLFQQVLARHPSMERARTGLARAQGGGRPVATPPPPAATPVSLPARLTAVPNRRLGLDFPEPLRALASHPLLQSPLTWAGGLALVILGTVGLSFWRQAARDRQLKTDVDQVIQEALRPAVKASMVVNLEESPDSILAESKATLAEDPLRAYHRAKEALRRTPGDPAAAQALELARAALALPDPSARPLKAGDPEAALTLVLGQLRSTPDDPKLLRKAAALLGTLAQLQAANGKWGAAKEYLQRARALYPEDKAWNARLYLLEQIPNQPKAEQIGWIALLW